MDNDIYSYYRKIKNSYKNNQNIDVNKLKENLVHLDNLYSKGKKTPLTDEEYDELHSIYIELTGNTITGEDSSDSKVKHDYPDLKGTISKVHYITHNEQMKDPNRIATHKNLEDWVRKTFDQIKGKVEYAMLNFGPKYDGVSVVLSIDSSGHVTKAITRGDIDEGVGKDKTNLFKNINFNIFNGNKVGLKIEAILSRDAFKEYNKKCMNNELVDERAGIVSLLNSEEYTKVHQKYISIIPLMYELNGKLRHIKSYDPDDLDVKDLDGIHGIYYGDIDNYGLMINTKKGLPDNLPEILEKFISHVKKDIDGMYMNCDGIVIRWINSEIIDILGRNYSRNVNNFEVAYKFPKESHYTHLIDIIQDIGVLGKVSYTAVFEPFQYNGRTVKHAANLSYSRLKSLNLAKGDLVNVKYEIIPTLYFDETCEKNRSGNKPIKLIRKCPYCNKPLNFDSEPYCDNKSCPSRIMGKIYNFCDKMRIDNIGEATIETLFHNKLLRDIPDLFNLESNIDEIIKLDGFDKKKISKIIKSINSLKASDSRILGSIGIPGISLKKAKLILSIYYLDELMKMIASEKEVVISKLKSIDGIGGKTAMKIVEGVDENRHILEFLRKRIKPEKETSSQLTVVFTGFRNPKFEKFLEEEHAFEVQNNINKSTKLLIAKNPNAVSEKIKFAKTNYIPIISMEDAYVRFGYKY